MNLFDRLSRTADGSIDFHHLGIEERYDYVVECCLEQAENRYHHCKFNFFLGQTVLNKLRAEGLKVTMDVDAESTTVWWTSK